MGKTLSLEVSTFLKVCEGINSPRSLACYLLIKNQEYLQYFELPPPMRGRSAHAFRDDLLVTEMLSKNVDLDAGIDRKSAALEKFYKAEASCSVTNKRFKTYATSGYPAQVKSVRYWVKRILGDLSERDLLNVVKNAKFGPGASTSCVGVYVTPSNKYACDMHTTSRLRPFANSLMGALWLGAPRGDIIVNEASKVTTVPKNAKTERVICIEPHLNIYCQLGVGSILRARLANFGIDLSTQEWNQVLASKAQEWRLATLDLSSASDMISLEVVKYLLPPRWYSLLNLCRCDLTVIDGRELLLEKFSSMGNGFTFELETVIFLASCLAAGAHPALTAVYGDDMIVPQTSAPSLVEILDLLGFEVNSKKSFFEGNFFESCGSDWYEGINVRPVYLRGDYNDADEASFLIANNIRRWSTTRISPYYWVSDGRLLPAWLHVVQRASRLAKMTCIPDGIGDFGFLRESGHQGLSITELPACSLPSKKTNRLGSYLLAIKTARGTVVKSFARYAGSYRRIYGPLVAAGVADLSFTHPGPETLRGSFLRSGKLRHSKIWHWSGVGPWF